MISVATLLYTGVVIYGFLGTKAFLKLRERLELPIPAYPQFYASFGLLLILVPASWLIVLEVLDRKEIDWSEGAVGISVAVAIMGSAFLGVFLSLKSVAAAYAF